MILSDKIILLRKEHELSQEQFAEQLSVSRQAVSKWESGASIPDLDKIIKISQLFGVSVDYLVKDDAAETGSSTPVAERDSRANMRVVSMEEANRYLETVQQTAPRIATGVLLCVMSPISVILLAGMAEYHIIRISEDFAGGIGIAVLLAMVAIAVVLFVTNGMTLGKYEFLEKDAILTAYGVSSVVEKKKADYEHTFHTCVASGVALCILGVIPPLIASATENEFYAVCGTCVLLFLVAIGVFLIVQSSIIWSSYQKLLQEGDYTPERKQMEKKNAPIASIYWCLVTAGYLGVSFYFNNWERSWIVWPVAGVLFAAIMGVYHLVSKDDCPR